MPQLVTRVDEDLLDAIDELVVEGVVASRSEAVRLGVGVLIERHRRSRIGAAMVEAYRRLPQTDTEFDWADRAAAAMIAREPW